MRDLQLPFAIQKPLCVKMYQLMIQLNAIDNVLYDAQRQGRISFYMTSYGEEATHVGSAAALEEKDVIFGQYREAGVIMYRGFSIRDIMNQCYSNHLDLGKGRQMPVHYGSKKLNFHTISSPLGTQIPQAVGAAYSLKLNGDKACSVCYFGEGAASEGDFHAALNMASTTSSPVIFFCRNNGYAISTPSSEQYKGDGIVSRAPGYGMYSIRVDGNDVLAVYYAMVEARKICVEQNEPVLIEAITYRVGHHSTSDDSTAYRTKDEVAENLKDSPIQRFKNFLLKEGYWSEAEEKEFKIHAKAEVLKEFKIAEKLLKPKVDEMFTDVFDTLDWRLEEQKKELSRLMQLYPEHYNASSHMK